MYGLADQAIQAALSSDWELALKLNNQIIRDDPKDVDTFNRLGKVYLELGNSKKAQESFKKVLKLDKYNVIAQKNLEKLLQMSGHKTGTTLTPSGKIHCDFIEEPGKTKVVSLVNPAPSNIISSAQVSTKVVIKPRRHKVAVLMDNTKQSYLGILPDFIGGRLKTLIDGGNEYEAYVKSAGKNSLTVFIRETKRAKKFQSISSFPVTAGTSRDEIKLDSIDSEHETKVSPAPPVEDEEDTSNIFSQKIANLHAEEPES